jgi:hypothetical protein
LCRRAVQDRQRGLREALQHLLPERGGRPLRGETTRNSWISSFGLTIGRMKNLSCAS